LWLDEGPEVELTIIDLCDGVTLPRDRRRVGIKTLQPIAHSRLKVAIVPEDV
jgi:hypothetical protein